MKDRASHQQRNRLPASCEVSAVKVQNIIIFAMSMGLWLEKRSKVCWRGIRAYGWEERSHL